MKRIIRYGIAVIAITTTLCAAGTSQKEEVRKSLHFKDPHASSRKVVVDNYEGSIAVVGYDGTDVELVVHKTIDGESNRKIEEAREKVTLDISEEEDRILIYVNAPWRCSDGSSNYRGSEYYGYEVQFDFELKVPAKTNLTLKTVNEGRITVDGVEGEFTVRNVNGRIEMTDIAGSGEATTVNGDVAVGFRKNPTMASSFKTINGKVDVKFQDGLSADLRLKTFNGEAYTDFAVEPLPSKAPVAKHSKHGTVYRAGDAAFVRVGNGGPELSFDTLNGNIYIARND